MSQKQNQLKNVKNQQELRLRKTEGYWGPRQFLLKGCARTYSDSLHMSYSTGPAAGKAPGTYGEKLNSLASEPELEGWLSPRQKCWQKPLFL